MTLKIWPYEIKTTCDTCCEERDPEQLWHLFKGEPHINGDIVCTNCIPEGAWDAWQRDGRDTDARNIMEWLLDGSPECAAAARETLAKVRENDELAVMRQRLIAHGLESRTFDSPAMEQCAKHAAAGTYRTWTREQLEAALAEAGLSAKDKGWIPGPGETLCPDCNGTGMDLEDDEPCRRCSGSGVDA